MVHGMHPDVLMVAGYAVLLVGVAAVLELVARQSHRLSEQFHIAGFTYHPQLDAWKCPTGQHLERKESDYGLRVDCLSGAGARLQCLPLQKGLHGFR